MIRDTPAGAEIAVRVIPRAHRTGVDGERDGALLIRLSAPPVDHAANEQLIEVLAATLGVPKRQVSLVGGARGRLKRLVVAGLTAAQVSERIARAIQRAAGG